MVHEISHGAVALRLGDDTAKRAGRLTLNPLKHLDPFGSVILPIILVLIQSPFLIGWAKPVPYNPHNLKDPKKGAGIIGAAGPISNLLIAIIFGIVLRLLVAFSVITIASQLTELLSLIIFINIILAIFNLLPLPPLDGANVLFALLPYKYRGVQTFLQRYGIFILILFIGYGFRLLYPVITALYGIIAGGGSIF